MKRWHSDRFLMSRPILAIALSFDRKKIYAASAKEISCFDINTGAALQTFEHHAEAPPRVLIAGDGWLAAEIERRHINILSEEYKPLRKIEMPKDSWPALYTATTDGTSLYFDPGYPNYNLQRVNATTLAQEWSFTGSCVDPVFSKDRVLFIDESEENFTFFIQDKAAPAPLTPAPSRFALSSDGNLLAYIGEYNIVHIKDLTTEKIIQLQMFWGGIRTLLFSPDQSRLLCASNEGDYGCFDVETGRTLFRAPLRCLGKPPMIFTDDVLYLAIEHRIERYNAHTGERLDAPQLCSPARQLHFANDALYASFTGNSDRHIAQLDTSGEITRTHRATHISAARDGILLAGDRAVFQRGEHTEALLSTINGREGCIFAAISPNASRFVIRNSHSPSTIIAYTRDGVGQAALEKDSYPTPCEGAFSSDGALFALIGKKPGILLFDAQTWALKDSLTKEKTRFHSLAFHPTQAQLVALSTTGELMMFDCAKKKRLWSTSLFKKKPRKEALPCIAISPDGALVFVGGRDPILRVLSLKDGKQKEERALPRGVSAITTAADGALYIALEDCSIMALPAVASSKKAPPLAKKEGAKITKESIAKIDWSSFVIERDLEPLKKALTELEKEKGITDAHKQCTKQLQALGARLIHANAHDIGPICYALSHNKKYLALGSWVGDDYERGGYLSIWEVASGRCINAVHIDGGVGWPGYDECIRWSPDDTRLGLAYSTNAVGCLDPFSFNNAWLGSSGATNGWSRPPAWCWSPDGSELMIACWGDSATTPGCTLPSDQGDVREQHVRWMSGPSSKNTENPEAIEPHKQVTWVNNLIIGYNSHDKAFAIDLKTRAIAWQQEITPPIALLEDGSFIHTPKGLALVGADGKQKKTYALKNGASSIYATKNGRIAVITEEGATSDDGETEYKPGVALYEDGKLLCQLKVIPKEKAFDFTDAYSWVWSPDGERGAVLTAENKVIIYSIEKEAKTLATIAVSEYTCGLLWGAPDIIIALSAESLQFWNASSGALIADHPFTSEAEGRPLSLKGRDLGARFAQNPSFPVKANGQSEWAVAFENGLVYCPAEAHSNLDTLLCFSLNGHSWPYRWSAIEPKESLVELLALPECPLPQEEREVLQKLAAKSVKKEVFPPKKKATLQDFIKAYQASISGLQSGWNFHISEQKRQLAILLARDGKVDEAKTLIEEIPEGQRHQALMAAASISMYCAKDKKQQSLAKEFLVLAEQDKESKTEWNIAWVHGSLGGAKFMLGDKKAAEKHFEEAQKGLLNETNPLEMCSSLASIFLEIGEKKRAFDIIKKGPANGFSHDYFLRFFQEALDAGHLDEVEDLLHHMKSGGRIDSFSLLDICMESLIRQDQLERLYSWVALFDGLYTKTHEAKILLALAAKRKEAAAKLWKKKIDKEKKWPDSFAFCVELGVQIDNKAAQPYLDELYQDRKALSEKASDKSEFLQHLAKALLLNKKTKEADELLSLAKEEAEKLALAVVLATPAAKKVIKALPQKFIELKENLAMLAKIAFEVGDKDKYKELIEKMLQLGTDWERRWSAETAIRIQTELGDWLGVYESMQKIPPSRRNTPLKEATKGAVRAGALAEGLFFLQKLPTTDLNDRPNVAFDAILEIAGKGRA